MDIVIIEDEIPAVKRLEKLIAKCRPEFQVVAVHDSVEKSVQWLKKNPHRPSLIFMDVQLADGVSFEIFSQIKLDVPIIFTTAYHEYALKAFKVNSVDYLLKPVDPSELSVALDKFFQLQQADRSGSLEQFRTLIASMDRARFKERFLVKSGQQLMYVSTSGIRYFYSENGLVKLKTEANKKHVVDYTLEQLEEMLSPRQFFRINRKAIIHIDAINRINTYFNSRLKLELFPPAEFEAIVSRDRVGSFKVWLDS